jgi:hypothetical protein
MLKIQADSEEKSQPRLFGFGRKLGGQTKLTPRLFRETTI